MRIFFALSEITCMLSRSNIKGSYNSVQVSPFCTQLTQPQQISRLSASPWNINPSRKLLCMSQLFPNQTYSRSEAKIHFLKVSPRTNEMKIIIISIFAIGLARAATTGLSKRFQPCFIPNILLILSDFRHAN